mmetsp:Transcript_4924/g.31512  ORF Transcript_4924/g.31512 Transcript_4924/m.31512 type:complete len:228 (+) Transcript_4924:402-1085(+)
MAMGPDGWKEEDHGGIVQPPEPSRHGRRSRWKTRARARRCRRPWERQSHTNADGETSWRRNRRAQNQQGHPAGTLHAARKAIPRHHRQSESRGVGWEQPSQKTQAVSHEKAHLRGAPSAREAGGGRGRYRKDPSMARQLQERNRTGREQKQYVRNAQGHHTPLALKIRKVLGLHRGWHAPAVRGRRRSAGDVATRNRKARIPASSWCNPHLHLLVSRKSKGSSTNGR